MLDKTDRRGEPRSDLGLHSRSGDAFGAQWLAALAGVG